MRINQRIPMSSHNESERLESHPRQALEVMARKSRNRRSVDGNKCPDSSAFVRSSHQKCVRKLELNSA
jgi:hypothetical protein